MLRVGRRRSLGNRWDRAYSVERCNDEEPGEVVGMIEEIEEIPQVPQLPLEVPFVVNAF